MEKKQQTKQNIWTTTLAALRVQAEAAGRTVPAQIDWLVKQADQQSQVAQPKDELERMEAQR